MAKNGLTAFLQSADYLRRFLATTLGFIVFGVAAALFALSLVPTVWRGTEGNLTRQCRARRQTAAIWWTFLRFLRVAGVCSFSLKGMEKLGRPGQLILANHPSLLDVVFMVGHVRDVNCIVKKDLLRNPLMRMQILACGYLPNDESEELVEKSHYILQNQCLLIFPEGTRTGWDNRISFHRGAVSIGLRSAQVITPVVIKMTPPNFKKGQAWYKIPKQKIHYEITVGDDIDPQERLREKPLPITARRLNDELQHYFQQETQ